jgi:hypothetical protein
MHHRADPSRMDYRKEHQAARCLFCGGPVKRCRQGHPRYTEDTAPCNRWSPSLFYLPPLLPKADGSGRSYTLDHTALVRPNWVLLKELVTCNRRERIFPLASG